MVVTTMNVTSKQLIFVHPDELTFQFELERQSFCDLKVTNNTDQNVAFKVKTTSPKRYYVRPNTGVLHPWDSCVIRVTLQAQQEYPPDMQCKDKFLLQSTIVSPNSDEDDLPQDTFNKDSGRTIEECKLRVVYVSPNSTQGNAEDDSASKPGRGLNAQGNQGVDDKQTLQRIKEERDAAVRQTQQLQQELEMWRRRSRQRKSNSGFSCKFSLFVAIIGIMLGILLKLSLSPPATA
ncbi:vesicle-associated protein 2-1-like isoform X1 [Chenopodium quinoa]|uniref:vesicle-associated protein 2-1-like isoform X1 n=1 Tax=Chenopodium quinoa TaxID=63459 RepID=UPI000B78E26F|nr:vesicle-associated protein 2-1-like isoform X1 [Chenopodium quinoa]XP_021768033.1 vesicle-associated protein 2-1-like isoform X1 [Chenopodium quinoa]